jgi:amino acid transporter
VTLGILRHPFGRPLRRTDLPHQVIAKRYALPVFASDALSSVAYATEEILKVLALAGTVYFRDAIWIALAIVVMLVLLMFSYRQTIYSYPNGGGAYIVSRDNLGESVAQIAGAALLLDYTLTVAVSISSGVANFGSGVDQFFPSVPPFNPLARTIIALGVLFLMWYVNRRGVRESGKTFAIPTYFFLACSFLLLAAALVKWLTGHLSTVQNVRDLVQGGQSLTLFLLLRAFASGSTALTGVEAISNGIPAFEEPKSKNAATTLAYMCGILGVLFLGITLVALGTNAQASTSETVISQIGRTVFSSSSPFYVCLIFGTAGVLVMAANTSFADFPRLAALQAADGFLPQWLTDRDNRLVFGMGITALAAFAGTLIAVFHADVDKLIPLYAIGVFVSFTLSQTGMVVRWTRVGRLQPGERVPRYSPEGMLVTTLEHDPHWRAKRVLNGCGAVMTATVSVVFAVAKFTEGAWLVLILLPLLVFFFFRIHHHYQVVRRQVALPVHDLHQYILKPVHRIVVLALNDINRYSLSALRDMVQNVAPGTLRQVVHVDVNEAQTEALRRRWKDEGLEELGLPLVIVPSTYGGGNVVGDLTSYIRGLLAADPDIRVEVVIPEWTPSGGLSQWLFTRLLHHMTGARLKLALLPQSRVTVTNHRYVLDELRPRRKGERDYGAAATAEGRDDPTHTSSG